MGWGAAHAVKGGWKGPISLRWDPSHSYATLAPSCLKDVIWTQNQGLDLDPSTVRQPPRNAVVGMPQHQYPSLVVLVGVFVPTALWILIRPSKCLGVTHRLKYATLLSPVARYLS